MKKINFLFCLCMMAGLLMAVSSASAQNVTLPRVSPTATLTQTLGLTQVTIVYSRPQANDRKVWGGLVAYDGKPWRAGANENTTISFSDDVTVEGKALEAGTYGLHVMAAEEEVTIVFSSNSTSWGSFSYNPKEDVLRVKVKPEACEHRELLTYDFVDFDPTNGTGTCALSWGKQRVAFNIAPADLHASVIANAKNELRSLPGFSWQGWHSAARYCLNNNVELEQGLAFVNRSMQGGFGAQANFTNMQTKSAILAKMGKDAEAAEIMKKAMQVATNAELNAYGYQHLQGGNHDKAIEIFLLNTEKNPEDPNVWDSLGEGYATRMAEGDKKLAIKAFKKSLSMNPADNVKQNSMKHLKKLGVN